MKILVVGSGGREHALMWALSRKGKHSLTGAPGNPGMGGIGRLFPVKADNIHGLTDLSRRENVDLVVVGPEVPLVAGLADELREAGIPCFGPGKAASMLEGSKWFAKEIMKAAGVPAAEGRVFSDSASAMKYISDDVSRYVLKVDGLAAGKGVFLPGDCAEARGILNELFSGKPGVRVVIEERLSGREVSILAICSGVDCVILPPSRDHKRLGEGDTGPNTGGMGAVCPPPEIDSNLGELARTRIILPVLSELASRGIDYRGVLYAGLMLTDDGMKVLEFNVRFGDPETQAVLPLLESDLAELCYSAALGKSLPETVSLRSGVSACVVLASGGYPGAYEKGLPITGLDRIEDAIVFHAGTAENNGRLVTAGGRVLSIVSVGSSLEESLKKAYRELDKIGYKGKYYRNDIGRTV